MLLIFGLGNNEKKLLHTKHNVGRVVVEILAQESGLNFEKKDKYLTSKFSLSSLKGFLLLSSGYMNNSGEVLSNFINFYKLPASELKLLIIQDDSDQLEGRWKLVCGGRSAGHRGIDSVYKHLPSLGLDPDQVWRLKIGIRPAENTTRSETFVLSNFSLKEMENFRSLANLLDSQLILLETNSWGKFQTELNKNG